MQAQLPDPSADALSVSRALQKRIADEIARSGGWISFSRYMELALYAPGLGYYSGGAAKFGSGGDFTTAPEMTPLFGNTLAHVAAQVMRQTQPRILEFGAGSGKLAYDVLSELAEMSVAVERYSILDLSGELRARQQESLRGFPQVEWLDRMPEAFSGVVLANEVLDAMPVQLVIKSAQGWQERGVMIENDAFAFSGRLCDASLIRQIPEADLLAEGYFTEVHPQAAGFMRSLAAMLNRGAAEFGRGGAAILIDYGFPAHEFYLDQRSEGTLMCHYRHHAHADPFYLPGLQDVTTHVDFTEMARAALDGGLDLLYYASQGMFLIDAGIGDLMMRTPPTDTQRYFPQASALQKLISQAEMGELFKVLVVGKDVRLPSQFERSDRSHRL